MSKYDELTDTPEGRRKRQQKRRSRLNEKAQALGFKTWSRLETAVINEDVALTIKASDPAGDNH